VDPLAWVNVGGGSYRVVLEHGSILGLDGRNVVFHACVKVVYVLHVYARW